jgi:hypothetical protein
MSMVSQVPEELEAALALSRKARRNWDESPPELQKLYIAHVGAPRKRRIREQRAADTALAARLGTLRKHAPGRTRSWWDVAWGVLPF